MIRGLLGALVALTGCGAQRAQRSSPGVVDASELRLMDGSVVRARLSMEGKTPVFALLDEAGRPGLRSELDLEGRPRITLFSNEATSRPIAILEGDEKGAHVLFHGNGQQQSYLFQKNDGTAGLVLTNAAGKHRAEVKLAPDGTANITLFDGAGLPRSQVSVSANGDVQQEVAKR